jgi:hypothetical protein
MAGAIFSQTDLIAANLTNAVNYTMDPELNIIKKAIFSAHGAGPGKYMSRIPEESCR